MKKYMVFFFALALVLFFGSVAEVYAQSSEVICPNGNTLSSNCTQAPGGYTVIICPNGNTLESNCTASPIPNPCPLGFTIGFVSKDCPFTEGNYPSSPVVISGVSGPQSLGVNQLGTWNVTASSPNGGNLSYSVIWGDEPIYAYAAGGPTRNSVAQQSASFTHSYSRAGTYTPTFYVTSENTIRCITTPCPSNAGKAQTSLSVNVGNVSPSSITVLSPNGGETWKSGTIYEYIKWQDNTTERCPTNTGCIYDITLQPYYPPCTGNICPMNAYPYRMPYPIAENVSGYSFNYSYNWFVGHTSLGNSIVPDDSYIVQICQSGTSICDSSDSFFKILSGTTTSQYDTFATCLKDQGAIFYGAFWCPHCQSQKKLFGSSEKLLPYVECSTVDGSGQIQVCMNKNITSYPTWEFADGSRITGEIPLKQLSEKTSCVLPQ